MSSRCDGIQVPDRHTKIKREYLLGSALFSCSLNKRLPCRATVTDLEISSRKVETKGKHCLLLYLM